MLRRDTRPSYSNSYAMEAATSQHTCYYRSGYDISIGHFPKVVFPVLEATPPNDRKYFLTFRVGAPRFEMNLVEGVLLLSYE